MGGERERESRNGWRGQMATKRYRYEAELSCAAMAASAWLLYSLIKWSREYMGCLAVSSIGYIYELKLRYSYVSYLILSYKLHKLLA